MKKSCYKKLSVALVFTAAFCLSTKGYAFDLVDAWHAAQKYDANFSAAKHARDSGKEKAAQGLAGLLPQINASSNYYRQNPIEPDVHYYETNGWEVNLTQPLFNIGKYAAYKQGNINSQMALNQFSVAEQKLIIETARAYLNVLLAYDTLTSTNAAKESYAKELEHAKLSFHIGTSTVIDTNEAQAHYDAAAAQEISAQTNLRIAAGVLQQLTGLDPKQIQLIDGKKVLDFAKPIALDDWQKIALKNSLDVKNHQYALQMASQDLLAKRGENWPKINLTASYNDNRNTAYPSSASFTNSGQRHTRGAAVGVELSIPIFAGGGINSQVKEAAAKELQARDELEASQRQVKEDVRSAYLGVTSGEAQVKSIEQLLKSTKSTLDSTRLGKEVGVRSNLDVLKAEQNYYETIRSLSETRYKYLLARLSLAQSAGVLEPAVLREINKTVRPVTSH